MKNKLYWILAVLAILALCLHLIPINREIDESYPCHVIDMEDETYSDQVTVTFQGSYMDYLFRDDVFKGRIHIEGYQFLSPQALPLELTLSGDDLSWISEFVPVYSNYEPRGHFYGKEDFSEFFLWLMIPDEDGSGGYHSRYFITYPAMTMDEIHEILS